MEIKDPQEKIVTITIYSILMFVFSCSSKYMPYRTISALMCWDHNKRKQGMIARLPEI